MGSESLNLLSCNYVPTDTCIWLSLGDTSVGPRFEVSLDNFTQVGEVRAWKIENSLPLENKGNFLGLKLA